MRRLFRLVMRGMSTEIVHAAYQTAGGDSSCVQRDTVCHALLTESLWCKANGLVHEYRLYRC